MLLIFQNKRVDLKEIIDEINSNLIVIGSKYDYSYFTPILEENDNHTKIKSVKFKLKTMKSRTAKTFLSKSNGTKKNSSSYMHSTTENISEERDSFIISPKIIAKLQ